MSSNVFDCSRCGHPAHKHTVKHFPSITPGCRDCGCTGYEPNYRKGDNT